MNSEFIAEVERKLNIRLPSHYSEFCKKPPEGFFEKIEEWGDGLFYLDADQLIDQTIGIRAELHELLRDGELIANEPSLDLDSLIAVGDDGTGDFFLLSLEPAKRSVYIFNHEEARLCELASNMEDFVKHLAELLEDLIYD